MFKIRSADYSDVLEIKKVMEEVHFKLEHKDWYYIGNNTLETLNNDIERTGFILVAENDKKEIIAYLIVRYPGEGSDNLALYLDYKIEDLNEVVHMKSVSVLPEYRGNNLQYKLIEKAETMLRENIRYSMCTVHPENIASLRSFEKNGYEIVKYLENKFGDSPRVVLLKEI